MADFYKELSFAIVTQAVKDLRLLRYKITFNDASEEEIDIYKDAETFLYSDWCEELLQDTITPEQIFKGLEGTKRMD